VSKISAEVVLKDIGGLSGTHSLRLVKGAINVVNAPNAAGKSTIIKALAFCLSAPYRSKSLAELAREMGLLRQLNEAVEPLVHMGASEAKISIKLDSEEWKLNLSKDGKYTYTREGDERFLITSVLTRSSTILNKLLRGDADFRGVIEAVSLAGKYEHAANIIEKERSKMCSLQEDVEKKRREEESLKKEQIALREAIDNYRHEESKLSRKLSELLASRPDVSELRSQRDRLQAMVWEQESKIKGINERIRKLKKEIEELTKRHEEELVQKERLERENKEFLEAIESKGRKLKELNERLKSYEERLKEIGEQIEALRVEEGRLLAKDEMYERALKLAAQSQRVLCFLCEEGYLTVKKLKQGSSLAKRQLSGVRDKIGSLLSERNKIYSQLRERDELENELKELRGRHAKITQMLQSVERALSTYSGEVKSLHESLAGFEASLKKEQEVLSKYRAELEAVEESIRGLGEEEQKVVENIAALRGRLEEAEKQLTRIERELEAKSYIEVLGYKLSLDDAKKVLDAWIVVLDDVLRHVRTEAWRERVMAVELFNDQVKRVLVDSKLEYLDAWIDASNYRFHVIDKRVNVEVSPRILSEAERYILAFIIHVALKLTYTPHVPFLLIDEVALSFDEVRKEAMLKYLSDLAEENGWFVVLTELGHEPKIVTSVLTSPRGKSSSYSGITRSL
jgi:chromosome segregation ATPase